MSTPIEEPRPGAAGPEGTPAQTGGTSADKPQDRESSGGDYLARVRSDPEFAVSQIREKDRRVSEANQRLKRYEPLEPHVESLGGGAGIKALLENYARLETHPQMREIVRSFLEQGLIQAPRAQANGPEPEPELDAFDPESLKRTIQTIVREAIQESIGPLRQQLGNLSGVQMKDHVKGLMGKLQQEFPDDFPKIQDAVERQVQQWMGNADGRKTLENLDYKVFRAIALNEVMEPDAFMDFAARQWQKQIRRQDEEKTGRATEVVAASTRLTPSGPQRGQSLGMTALEALREFSRENGLADGQAARILQGG